MCFLYDDCVIRYFLCCAVILDWFVNPTVAKSAISGDRLVEEDEVECRPEKVPCSVLDENVDICLVRHYFTVEAWKVVDGVMKKKEEIDEWLCSMCHHDLHSKPSIICELCLKWYHFSCVGLTAQPKKKNWFCRQCIASL